MKLLSFLPIFLLVSGISSFTVFRANGTLSCHYDVKWCYSVLLWEKDVDLIWNNDDLVGVDGIYCILSRDAEYHMDGYQNDDGLFDHTYEIFVEVVHNCTETGSKKKLTSQIAYESVHARESSIAQNFNVTDQGELVAEYF